MDAVRRACQLCQTVARQLVHEDTYEKKDRSPVTVADLGAQVLISLELARHYSQPVVGEEDSSPVTTDPALLERVLGFCREQEPALTRDGVVQALDRCNHGGGASGSFWVLDPIDGTKGFLRRQQYAVALGLVQQGQVTLGLLGCPNLPHDAAAPDGPAGLLFWASRGAGARVVGLEQLLSAARPVQVSPMADPTRAPLCESVEAGHTAHGAAAQVARQLGLQAPPVRMDSQCKYGAVARGEAAIYLRLPTRPGYQEKIWDHAAGSLLVHEAGGRVTDVDGRALDFGQGRTLAHNIGIICTNGAVHEATVQAVRRVLGR